MCQICLTHCKCILVASITLSVQIIVYLHLFCFSSWLLLEWPIGFQFLLLYTANAKFIFTIKKTKHIIRSIVHPQKKTLLSVLSTQEVTEVLKLTENIKHKAVLMTIYSAGLRISEVINLKFKDIDSDRMQIRIEQGKVKVDRYTLI